MYNLFLDDERVPAEVGNYIYPVELRELYRKEEWTIVRDYDHFISVIKLLGLPKVVSLDHDLADEHYAPTGISYNDFEERTGHCCLKWMIDYIQENDLSLPEVYVHSLNPVGGENMEKLWENFKKHYGK